MHTLRGRIAMWYAVALGATIFVFGTIVYAVERSGSLSELDGLVRLEGDLIAAILNEASRARGTMVAIDDQTARPVLVPDVAALLEGVPGYVAVLGPDSDLFLSGAARALPFSAVEQLTESARAAESANAFRFVTLPPPLGELRMFVRLVGNAGPEVTAVVSAASTAGLGLRPQRLLSSMILTAPFVVVASLFVGYFLVGRTLAPVDRIVDEVKAISDGRSLHRRLATSYGHDELTRLTTTLNLMLARLERSFGTLRRFTADASHELKTPLTVFRTGIERSITHAGVPRDVLETLEELLLEANRMAELVDSLLTLARADEGRAPLHLDRVDLRELLMEVAETAGILGEQAGVSVHVEVPEHPVVIEVDGGRVRQMVMNLLTNAVKYTQPEGHVSVTSTMSGDEIVLRVVDTGIGIAPGDLPHIFDRFWRADVARSRTGSRPGAGLGLAISKWTAEAHGGSIDVQSRPGKGTTFTVRLPLRSEQKAGPAA